MAAWINGAPSDLDAAVQAAANLLRGARAPVVAGLCADVPAIRAAYRLAETLGASLDPAAADSLYADLDALSTGISMTTTAPEARGRADVVLVLGKRPWSNDLAPTLAASEPTRGRTAGVARNLIALGGPDAVPAPAGALGTGNVGLAAALGQLRAFVRGHLAGDHPLAGLAETLGGAAFGVALYDPAELGALGVEMLQGLVGDLNDKTRFFTLSTGDDLQGRSVQQLGAWTTGQAPRVGFGRGLPEHDPWRFDSARQVAAGEVDAALWLAALPAPAPAWLGHVPAIAILGADAAQAAAQSARIVFGVGVPGRDVGGAVWNAQRGAIAYVEAAPAGGSEAGPERAGTILTRIRDHLIQGRA